MLREWYIAYSIYDIELACGCGECVHYKVYDESGNRYKRFSSKEEAEDAGRTQMLKKGHDRYNTLGPCRL